MEKFGLGAALVAVLVGTAGFSEPSRPELVRFLSGSRRVDGPQAHALTPEKVCCAILKNYDIYR